MSKPGNLCFLSDQQQQKFCVDEAGPTGETCQQQNKKGPLHNDADLQEVPAPKRLKPQCFSFSFTELS